MFPLKKEKRHVLGNAIPKQIEQVTRGHNIIAYPQLKILVETKFKDRKKTVFFCSFFLQSETVKVKSFVL